MITTTQFDTILSRHGEDYTLITTATTYEEEYGSIESETETETTITAYAQPIEETHPLVMQGKIKSGSSMAWSKPTDAVAISDILQDSNDVKWKVARKERYRDETTDIYDEMILIRNE